jgi:hypothetical protein
LLQDKEFAKVLQISEFQEVVRATEVCLVRFGSGGLQRDTVMELKPAAWRFESATRGYGRCLFVESSDVGQRLGLLGEDGTVDTLYRTNPPERNADAPPIHSLYLSPSGRLLAFMVSRNARWCDWREQRLVVYDLCKREARTIWNGAINGPRGMLNPYQMVQPLPWSPDEKRVALSTLEGQILTIDLVRGEATAMGPGDLPVGFLSEERLLFLRRLDDGSRRWLLLTRDTETKRDTPAVVIDGPSELRAPLLSFDSQYVSFVGRIFPMRTASKGVHQYTIVVRLRDLDHLVLPGEVTSWSRKHSRLSPESRSAPSPATAVSDRGHR